MHQGNSGLNESQRFILVVESPFSARDANRFGVREIQNEGYRFEAWNVGPIYLRGAQDQYVDRTHGASEKRFNSIAELCLEASRLNVGDIVVTVVGVQVGQVGKYRKLHQLLSRSTKTYGAVTAAPVVDASPPGQHVTLISRAKKSMQERLAAGFWLSRFIANCYRKVLRIRPLNFLWVATESSLVSPLLISKDSVVIPVHSLDYDLLIQGDLWSASNRGTLLLIDNMGPDHPDFVALEEARAGSLSSSDYFAGLCQQLSVIEDILEQKIEIAGHPRARPGTLEEKYQMRTVHYGETAQRIAEAKLILITGATTAVGMAVALKKPIVMIKADGTDISEQVRDEALVDILKLHVWDQDLDTSARSFFNIDAERYDRFVEKFVKTRGSTKALFWQAVLDSLQNRKLPSTRRL